MIRSPLDILVSVGASSDDAVDLEQILDGYNLTIEVGSNPLPTGFNNFLSEETGIDRKVIDDLMERFVAGKFTVTDPEGDYSYMQSTQLIASEMDRQGKMWGEKNERADVSNGELMQAAWSYLSCLLAREYHGVDDAFSEVPESFPESWSGFRDYGSPLATLSVIVAFLTNEMRRRIRLGESDYRKPRDPVAQPYTKDQPNELVP